MGRPRLKENQKKMTLSISLDPELLALAEKTSNKSHFIETSIQACESLRIVLGDLRAKKISQETALEKLEDVADVWEAEFDDSVKF